METLVFIVMYATVACFVIYRFFPGNSRERHKEARVQAVISDFSEDKRLIRKNTQYSDKVAILYVISPTRST